MSESKDETRKDFLSNMYFKISLFLLLFGIIFTLGQVTYLNSFIYLNTFTYIDFLINTVLIAPFILVILLVVSLLSDFFIKPISAIYDVYFSIVGVDKSSRGFWLGLCHVLINLFHIVSLPMLLLVLGYLFFLNTDEFIVNFYYSIFLFLVFSLLLRYLSKKTKDYAIEKVSTFSKGISDGVMEKFTSVGGVVASCILVFFFGCMYIDFQDISTTDATILVDEKSINVNILTSNSNFIVAYKDKQIEIIPRSEIKSIRHDFLYLDNKFSKNKP